MNSLDEEPDPLEVWAARLIWAGAWMTIYGLSYTLLKLLFTLLY